MSAAPRFSPTRIDGPYATEEDLMVPYCGLCDGEHEPRHCPATRAMQDAEPGEECPGCGQTLTDLDLAGVTAEIAYDSQDRPWHRGCYDDARS